MWRRHFLQLTALTTLATCSARALPPSRARQRAPIRAVAFDLFTIFDPRTIDRRVAEVVGGEANPFASTWKSRLFEYSWIHAVAARYRDFQALVDDSLTYAARAHSVTLSRANRERLAAAFTELDPWPDARASLHELRTRGLRLGPLANFAPSMIDALLRHASMAELFDTQISTDAAQTYKPDPRAYALAEARFDLPREQIAFAAFGGWDAAGATWFGFPTYWVNRLGVAEEELVAPQHSGLDLVHLARWLATT
ncbi:MAG TPA: haloacid dehalogenase type II [Kofleriaceae bacterium]